MQKTIVIPHLQYTEKIINFIDEQDRARGSRKQSSPTKLVEVISCKQVTTVGKSKSNKEQSMIQIQRWDRP